MNRIRIDKYKMMHHNGTDNNGIRVVLIEITQNPTRTSFNRLIKFFPVPSLTNIITYLTTMELSTIDTELLVKGLISILIEHQDFNEDIMILLHEIHPINDIPNLLNPFSIKLLPYLIKYNVSITANDFLKYIDVIKDCDSFRSSTILIDYFPIIIDPGRAYFQLLKELLYDRSNIDDQIIAALSLYINTLTSEHRIILMAVFEDNHHVFINNPSSFVAFANYFPEYDWNKFLCELCKISKNIITNKDLKYLLEVVQPVLSDATISKLIVRFIYRYDINHNRYVYDDDSDDHAQLIVPSNGFYTKYSIVELKKIFNNAGIVLKKKHFYEALQLLKAHRSKRTHHINDDVHDFIRDLLRYCDKSWSDYDAIKQLCE
jgi:hypothetical protein